MATVSSGTTARQERAPGERTLPREALVRVEGVTVRFGGIVALDSVSFEIRRNEVLGLIGPNGAGKTTLFNCFSRLYRPTEGDIVVEGQAIGALPAHRMAAIGLGRTFQNVALFNGLSVRDNIRVGAHTTVRTDPFSDAIRASWARLRCAGVDRKVAELIEWLDLIDVADLPVEGLPFGTRKRVEMARAMAAEPKLLMLDEPAAGLNREEVEELGRTIRQVRDKSGVSVLLVEHNMGLVMAISDRITVLNFGRKIAEGTPAEIQRHPDVLQAYLGGTA